MFIVAYFSGCILYSNAMITLRYILYVSPSLLDIIFRIY
jgi:hypothetical protein